MKENAVIIFARYPVDGKVKTRLASTTGNKFASDFYKICSEHTFNECLKLKKETTDLFLFYSEKEEKELIENWTDNRFKKFPQKGNELGEKMLNSFKKVFNKDYKNVLIIGTDAPGISLSILVDAFFQLNENDFVIGPSNDGGYYLLGMKNLNKNLFENINWSTSSVFEQTIKKLKNEKYSMLEKLIDIDTEDDLLQWLKKSKTENRVKEFLINNYKIK